MIQKPRGTQDFFLENLNIFNYIKKELFYLSDLFNFSEIKTPMFEDKKLFSRSIGSSSDIVNKEMFYIKDKYALKPEGTAPIIRTFIENKQNICNFDPKKLFYFDSMFRYERPQKGRLREFHQFGAEVIHDKNFLLDSEIIIFAIMCIKKFNINDFSLHINSLGSIETQKKYKIILKDFLKDNILKFCSDCNKRFKTNILRILDCKLDTKLLKNIPKIYDYSSESEKEYLDNILTILKNNNINFIVDHNLVRGLDYYTSLVFEIKYNKNNNAQNTILGGGRYDNLINQLDNKYDLGAIGFAIGIERLMSLIDLNSIKSSNNNVKIYFITLSTKASLLALELCYKLRNNNISAEMNLNIKLSLKQQFKKSDKFMPTYISVIGDEELRSKTIILKNKKNNNQKKIEINKIVNFLKKD